MEDAPSAPRPFRFADVPLALAGLALLVVSYASSLSWLVGRWLTDPFYSHGPLVPIVSVVLVWVHRNRLRLGGGSPLAGLGVLLGAVVLHLLGSRLRFEALSVLSLLAAIGGLVLLAGGAKLLRNLRFPLLFLLFAIPLPLLLIEKISLPLQLFSTVLARALLASLGCGVTRQGVLLIFPKFTLAVADACSGLRSVITVLAVSTLGAYLSSGSTLRRTVLVFFSAIAALLLNALRITVTGLIGVAFDGKIACLLFERYSGYILIALVVISTLALFRLLGGRQVGPSVRALESEPLHASPSPGVALRVLLAILLLVLPGAWIARGIVVKPESSAPTRLSGWQPSLLPWRTSELRSVSAAPGEEALTGLSRDSQGRWVRWSVLHSVSGRYLHSPEACSLAAGWIPERQELREEGGVPIHFWVLRRGSDRACVLFWFTQEGVPRLGSFAQHLAALGARLRRGTIDSAYGEVVVPLSFGQDPGEDRLLDLGRKLEQALRERLWPSK